MFALDSFAARSCQLRTYHNLHPRMIPPPTPSPTVRPGAPAEFVEGSYQRILSTRQAVDLRGLDQAGRAEQEAACLKAMTDGAPVIVGGILPQDLEGHRSGRPHLLVRDPAGGYFPGVVKFQQLLEARQSTLQLPVADLDSLSTRRELSGWRYRWTWRWPNAVQLAHYWRLLEAIGHQAASGPAGVVVGNDDPQGEGRLGVWLDLTSDSVAPGADQLPQGDPLRLVSALRRYDHEFAIRLNLAEQATLGQTPTALPVVSPECRSCPWWSDCRPKLDDDDLSLRLSKSRLDRHEITVLRQVGVGTVHHLAEADLDELLPRYLPRVNHRHGAEDRLRLAHRRARMLSAGVELERLTNARIQVPSAELEIDIDVETSGEDRVYLWGFWVDGSYQAFSDFGQLDDAGEVDLACRAMAWLRDQVQGRDALVYHYSDYERVRLARLATSGKQELAWAMDFAAESFVDLFGVVRQHFFGANGLGLKTIATAGAGFHWRDEDPGGLNSMRWYDQARGAPSAVERLQAQRRLLEYNEDDVKATWRLREWLRAQ